MIHWPPRLEQVIRTEPKVRVLSIRHHTTKNGVLLDCGHELWPGDEYGVWVGIVDGEFKYHHFDCPACEQEEYEAWLKMNAKPEPTVGTIAAELWDPAGERVQCRGRGNAWYIMVDGKTSEIAHDAFDMARRYRRTLKAYDLSLDAPKAA